MIPGKCFVPLGLCFPWLILASVTSEPGVTLEHWILHSRNLAFPFFDLASRNAFLKSVSIRAKPTFCNFCWFQQCIEKALMTVREHRFLWEAKGTLLRCSFISSAFIEGPDHGCYFSPTFPPASPELETRPFPFCHLHNQEFTFYSPSDKRQSWGSISNVLHSKFIFLNPSLSLPITRRLPWWDSLLLLLMPNEHAYELACSMPTSALGKSWVQSRVFSKAQVHWKDVVSPAFLRLVTVGSGTLKLVNIFLPNLYHQWSQHWQH